MKKKILAIIILLLLFGGAVFAQEVELPKAGLTPNSPFYFLETITEWVGTFFTFGDIKKAERYVALAAERLAEVQAVAEKGKPKLIEKTLQRYENQLNNSISRAKKAQTKGQNTEKILEVVSKVGKATSVHLEILFEVYEKVSEQAKPAIENAMKASVKGHEKVVEVLKAKDALGEIPEEVSLPVGIPEEARERVQMKVQQELMIEKVLQDYESPRDLCKRMGGPSEICEKISLQGFKSFKEIEDFCTEGGGPPEYCMSIESKCKEFGVTIPDECFRVISIATLETYQSIELNTYPADRLPEEEMEGRGIQVETEQSSRKKAAEESIEELEHPVIDAPEKVQERVQEKINVIIYTGPNCGYCGKAKAFFEKNNIEYTEKDIAFDDNARNEAIEKSSQTGVPVIDVNGEIIIGFNENRLSELLSK